MIGKKLRKLRRDRELTQEQIADFLGLTRPAYTAYELGKRNPSNQTLLKLAKYYNVSLEFLIDDSMKRP